MKAEGLYEQLLEMVRESGSLYEVDRYENDLKSKFPEEVK